MGWGHKLTKTQAVGEELLNKAKDGEKVTGADMQRLSAAARGDEWSRDLAQDYIVRLISARDTQH